MRKMLAILLLFALLLSACQSKKSMNEESSETSNVNSQTDEKDEKDDTITVYLVSPKENEDYYFFGESQHKGKSVYGESIEEYARKNQKMIHVEYFGTAYEMEEQLESDYQQDCMPDLILCDKSTSQVIYSYILEGGALDLSPYIEKREEGEYTQTLMEAGLIEEKQVILPLLYDIAALYTTKDWYREKYIGIEGAMGLLDSTMNRLWQQDEFLEVLYSVKSGSQIGSWRVFWNALGGSAVSWETETLPLSESKLSAGATFFRRHYAFENDYDAEAAMKGLTNVTISGGVPERAEVMQYLVEQAFFVFDYSTDTHEAGLRRYQDVANLIAFRLDGVHGGFQNFYSSMALQTQFYNTVLSGQNCEFALVPLSIEESAPSYNAAIVMFGFVPISANNPNDAADLLMFLQDVSTAPQFGFSVNESVNERNIKILEGTAFRLDNTTDSFGVYRPNLLIDPLPHELGDQIRDILSHVDKATLPNDDFESSFASTIFTYREDDMDWESAYEQLQEKISDAMKRKWATDDKNEE